VTPLKEVEVAKLLAGRCRHVPGFGSTDDPEAPSHLFRCGVAETLSYIGLTT
jgi:Uri superfamily endonuclease